MNYEHIKLSEVKKLKITVPIIIQKENSDSYWTKSIFAGFRQSAEKHDYKLEFINDAENTVRSDFPDSSSIIVSGYTTEWLEETLKSLIKKGFNPIVVNACLSPWMRKHCNGISFALDESVEHSIQYLYLTGRQHIALLGINKNSLADQVKRKTFLKVKGELFPESNDFVFYGRNPLYDCVNDFIDEFVKGDINAVVCANDTVAIYLINRMIEDGFNIPEDLYIMGMGNTKLGQKISIPLTSIDFNYEELGKQAIELWCYLQKFNSKIHVNISVPCKIIIRATTSDNALTESEYTSVFLSDFSSSDKETNIEEYYEDAAVQKIIKFEAFLKSCDNMDFCILEGIMHRKNDNKLAESLNMSDRAIRYRISKMTKKLGIQTREEICNIINEMKAFQ